MLLPGGRGGRGPCRAKAKLGGSLALPNKDLAGIFQPTARLKATILCQYRQQKIGVSQPEA